MVVVAEHSTEGQRRSWPGRWGSEVQATHWREGEVGHNVQLEGKMRDTSRSQIISTQIQEIAEQANEYPEMVFTTLAHRMDVEWLRAAYRQTNKSSAAGIDGITAAAYAANLAENLQELHQRLKDG